MITALTGKNAYAISKYVSKIIADKKDSFEDLSVERFDAAEVEANKIIQAAQSLPFLTSNKTVIVDNVQKNQVLLDRVEELIERTPETVDLVLIGPQFDKRKNTYKILKKDANLKEFSEVSRQELPSWVIDVAKNLDAEIDFGIASFLVDRVGQNQLMLSSEIDKLATYSKEISKKNVELLTDQSVQSTVFSLLDAAFTGDREKSISIYRGQRSQRVDPHYIVAMLTWQLNNVAYAVFADPPTESTLMAAGLSPFSTRKSISLARRITKKDLRKMVKDLSELDMQIKTSVDADAALELFLLSL